MNVPQSARLTSKTQIKVRLEGIETPERAQPFDQKARQALAKRVFGKVVHVVRRR